MLIGDACQNRVHSFSGAEAASGSVRDAWLRPVHRRGAALLTDRGFGA